MRLLRLEHSRVVYAADFAVYGLAVAVLAVLLLVAGPREEGVALAALALAGLSGWTLVEYLLHRFVLHGVWPFRDWHEAHHRRPGALISTPTILSAMLIAALVFAPALAWGGTWRACALTLGVLGGYLAYTVTHHATHHWRARNAWFARRKRWHELHHRCAEPRACFGVTSGFWDHVFGSAGRAAVPGVR